MALSTAQEFKNLLVQAIQNLQNLKQILLQEKSLLQVPEHTPEQLEALTQQKQQALELIQQDIDARNEFFATQNLSNDPAGIEAFFASLAPKVADALQRGWAQLVGLLEEVQEHNSFNARLINRANQHFDLLLNTFQNTGGQGKVYSAAGSSGSLNMRGNLGSA